MYSNCIPDLTIFIYELCRVVSIAKLKQEHLDFFEGNSITFLMYGKQEDSIGDPKLSRLTTKVHLDYFFFNI